MMGKQRLSSMFTSSVFNKSREGEKGKGLSCDSIVDEVIAEFAPDEADREKRRRAQPAKSFVPIRGVKSERVNNGVDLSRRLGLDQIVANGSGFVHGKEMDKDSEGKEELDLGNCQPQVEQFHDFSDNKEVPDEKKTEDSVEVLVEAVVKKEDGFTLNAKIKEAADPALSAIAGWKAVMTGGAVVTGADSVEVKSSEGSSDFDLESDGSLPFYMLDAYEEFYGPNMGTVYLFGKVKVGSSYQSCCAVVKNMQRCVYAFPDSALIQTDEMMKLEKDLEESRISPTDFRKKLHDAASELKNEIAKKLMDLNVSVFSMTPVKRNYAFDRTDIPAGESYVLKINYPFRV